MDEMMTGMALGSAASMLITFGMGLQLFRSKVAGLTRSQEHIAAVLKSLVEQQKNESGVLREMVRVLGSLDVKHTPERADGYGFGTEWLHEPVETMLREQRAHAVFTAEFRKEHTRVHEELLRVVQGMAKT